MSSLSVSALNDLARALSALDEAARATTLRGDGTVVVSGVQHDSRKVAPGELFVAIQGERFDGNRFIDDAVSRGAAAIVSERALSLPVPTLEVADARRALSRLSALVYGKPTERLSVIGVTGTNGKTTTTHLIEAALRATGAKPALMGTLGARAPGLKTDSVADAEPLLEPLHTTPESDDLARFAKAAADTGATHLVMEVSSHAIALQRVEDVRFEVAAFTNLSPEHLDFHGDMEGYRRAKERLFFELGPENAVINIDDSSGAELARKLSIPRLTCSMRPDSDADIAPLEWSSTRNGLQLRVRWPRGVVELRTSLFGNHNVQNVLVALACIVALGSDVEQAATGISQAEPPPGRLERIEPSGDAAVFVDYAHTPDALVNVLEALRPTTSGRLIVTFGAGGDRDLGKRPLMGRVAAEHAEITILTTDNPRSEDPALIIRQIEVGVRERARYFEPSSLPERWPAYTSIVDRRRAIELAISLAEPGDTVLIAGKGHETYQIVGSTRHHFDDRIEARRAIENRRVTKQEVVS